MDWEQIETFHEPAAAAKAGEIKRFRSLQRLAGSVLGAAYSPSKRAREDKSGKDAKEEPAPPQRRRVLPKVGGYDEYADGLRTYYEKRAQEDRLKRRVFSREKASVDRLHDTHTCEGWRILERIRIRMNSMGLVRTKPLRQIQDAFLVANLQPIFGKDLVRNIPALLKMFGVAELAQMIALTTMRQAGKTTGVQSSEGSCLLEIPAWKSVAFAPTKRQSTAIATGTYDMITRQPDGAKRVVKKNQEELVVTPTSGGEPHKNNPKNSILRCLPASEKGLGLAIIVVLKHTHTRTPRIIPLWFLNP